MRRKDETGRTGGEFPPARRDAASPAGAGSKGERGFSLVEVTLALLVVAVGMTAAFSLFPEAIRNTRAAQDNTEAALFADYVFSTLELAADYYALEENVDASGLDEDADQFSSDSFSGSPTITAGGRLQTFYWKPANYGISGASEMTHALQGKLKTAVFTYKLTLKNKAGSGSPVIAVLKVWPGEYGKDVTEKDLEDANARSTRRVFYREILPPK
jgi:prepilin-type N-terminal cleavage/methylation domain-containing protein